MDRWLVVKEGAYLSVPDADSSKACFVNDRAQAQEFELKMTAQLWAWDLDAQVVPAEQPSGP